MAGNLTMDCFDDYYNDLGDKALLIGKFIMPPVCFLFGIIGHGLCLVAFAYQWKKEKTYMYQILVTFAETMTIIVHFLYALNTISWSGLHPRMPPWHSTSYICLWIQAYLGVFLDGSFPMITQMLCVFMAYDRFCALWKKISYNAPTKNTYIIITATCVIVSFSTNIFISFSTDVKLYSTINGTYLYEYNLNDFFFSPLYHVFSQIRDILRIVFLIAQCFFNVGIPYLYYKQLGKIQVISDQTERKRRRAAKLLTMISLNESIFITIATMSWVTFYIFLTVAPTCYFNKIVLVANTTELLSGMASVLNFYAIFSFNRQFRSMIFKSVPFFKWFVKSTPVAIPAIQNSAGHVGSFAQFNGSQNAVAPLG